MKIAFYSAILFLLACTTAKNIAVNHNNYQNTINLVAQQYAPDKRVALFNITAKGNVLTGETNMQEAKIALLQKLSSQGLSFTDSIKILPAEDLNGKHFAAITVSVGNLRTQPRHPAELATQAMMGTGLKVLKKERGWYLVQTPDKYLSWIEGSNIELMDSIQYTAWQQKPKLIFTKAFGFAYENGDANGATTSDLVFGAIMELKGTHNGFYEVAFPDGRKAFVLNSEAKDYRTWASSLQPTEDNFVKTAKQMMGIPYLWGGTSFKGVDCSGFTKTVFFMNGLVLPRDASQQVTIGDEIDTKNGWENLRPGDLLFFGVPAKDGNPEKVVHVGMWIGGNAEFIHSSGRVQIGSFNAAAPNFDAGELKRFLRAKRVSSSTALYDLRKASF